MLKPTLISLFLIVCFSNSNAQTGCGINQFKALTIISRKDSLTDLDLDISVQLLKKLERDRCYDYIGKKNGKEYVISERTFLFGQICLKKNSYNAVKEYLNYLKREHGSAEEELSNMFEEIFTKRPEDILSMIGYDKYLLNALEFGFYNNHFSNALTAKNYKKVFFDLNPEIKRIYPKYKQSVDYLLNQISKEIASSN